MPVKTAVCANDGLASSLSGLSQSVSDDGTDGTQSGVGRRYHLHSLAKLFCLPESERRCISTSIKPLPRPKPIVRNLSRMCTIRSGYIPASGLCLLWNLRRSTFRTAEFDLDTGLVTWVHSKLLSITLACPQMKRAVLFLWFNPHHNRDYFLHVLPFLNNKVVAAVFIDADVVLLLAQEDRLLQKYGRKGREAESFL